MPFDFYDETREIAGALAIDPDYIRRATLLVCARGGAAAHRTWKE